VLDLQSVAFEFIPAASYALHPLRVAIAGNPKSCGESHGTKSLDHLVQLPTMSADQDDDLYGDLQVSSDTVLAADVSLAAVPDFGSNKVPACGSCTGA
jgi:hypothetical protein